MNPRLVAQHTISSRADSAALALLRDCSLVRLTAQPGIDGATDGQPLARGSPAMLPKGRFEFTERSPIGNLCHNGPLGGRGAGGAPKNHAPGGVVRAQAGGAGVPKDPRSTPCLRRRMCRLRVRQRLGPAFRLRAVVHSADRGVAPASTRNRDRRQPPGPALSGPVDPGASRASPRGTWTESSVPFWSCGERREASH